MIDVTYVWRSTKKGTKYEFFLASTSITCHVWISGLKKYTGTVIITKTSLLLSLFFIVTYFHFIGSNLCSFPLMQCMSSVPWQCLWRVHRVFYQLRSAISLKLYIKCKYLNLDQASIWLLLKIHIWHQHCSSYCHTQTSPRDCFGVTENLQRTNFTSQIFKRLN